MSILMWIKVHYYWNSLNGIDFLNVESFYQRKVFEMFGKVKRLKSSVGYQTHDLQTSREIFFIF